MKIEVFFFIMKPNLTRIVKNSSALPTVSSENVNTRTADYNIVISICIRNCAVNAKFSLLAFLGNAAILTAFYESSTHHLPSSILLACLSASDLTISLVAQPLFMLYRSLVPRRQFLVLRTRLLATENEAPEEGTA